MILGLGVAALWGVGDLFAAMSARRLGTFTTLVVAQIAELVLCIALWALLQPTHTLRPGTTIALLLVGVATAVAYGCLYRGLMLGPVTLVTPIAAAYAVGPTVLAVVLLGERLPIASAAGAAATILGVILATAKAGDDEATHTRGVPFAFAAMIGFALSAFLIAAFAERTGWLLPLLISRIGVAVALAVAAVAVPSLATAASSTQRHMLPVAAAAGVCNLVGTALYAHSGEIGQVAITSAVSALFPLVPIFGGLLLFRERLGARQIAGVAMVLTGLVLLGNR